MPPFTEDLESTEGSRMKKKLLASTGQWLCMKCKGQELM